MTKIDHPITIMELRSLPDDVYTENCTLDEWLSEVEKEYLPVIYSILVHRAQENLYAMKID